MKLSQLDIHMELTSSRAIISAVIADKGLSILPYKSIHQEIIHEAVKTLIVEGVDFRHPFTLLYHPNKLKESHNRKFFDLLINEGCFC